MSSAQQINWKIDNSLFYPLGLVNHSTINKTFFLTWGHSNLLIHIFQKHEAGGPVLTDTLEFNTPTRIKSVTFTTFNTLVLLENGDMYYFSSANKFTKLNFLQRVISVCRSEIGFAIIELSVDNNVNLKIYKDFKNKPNENIVECNNFDISFNDSRQPFCNSDLKQKYMMLAVAVTDENRIFFKFLLKMEDITSKELYFFSLHNSVYCLLNDPESSDTEFEICLILDTPSEINMIQFISTQKCFIIFLASGIIEILFFSVITEEVDKMRYFICADFYALTFANDILYYSDGNRIVQINFQQDLKNSKLQVFEKDQIVPGMVALTWVKEIKKLVCLSENNLFYRVKFDTKESENNEPQNLCKYFELSKLKCRSLEVYRNILRKLVDEPKHLQDKINEEKIKQEILTFSKKINNYEQIINSSCKFTRRIPALQAFVVYPEYEPHIGLCDMSYFAVIKIKIKEEKIFSYKHWKVYIYCQTSMPIFRGFNLTENMIGKNFYVILNIPNFNETSMPTFEVKLITIVNVSSDDQLVSFSINIEEIDVSELFSAYLSDLPTVTVRRSEFNRSILNLFKIDNPHQQLIDKYINELSFRMIVPPLVKIKDICAWFQYDNLSGSTNKLVLYFINVKLTLTYFEEEHYLLLQTTDPFALYYAKYMLAQKFSSHSSYGHVDFGKLHEKYLECQALIESRSKNSVADIEDIEFLLKIYTDLRQIKHY